MMSYRAERNQLVKRRSVGLWKGSRVGEKHDELDTKGFNGLRREEKAVVVRRSVAER